ncbi:putative BRASSINOSTEROID INSENSITIVE 1-associated receptor kinase 1 precursor [Hibiscus syriacus]|uniref:BRASSINOSTEROID INSENSITIVE 1-associated receptor kinase 1 n=1 Tax=Hibiscus syriacus TaxID=106335 RepID=A0A6A3AHY8_HIBSY|nr:putative BRASSINOSTEROID INSENSITIVE 1-associated receptor kinase 1 precursor [Hibiscus syriacus]
MTKDKNDILSLSWMKLAMESLSEIHCHIKNLIAEIELTVTDWGEKWIDVYLDISAKLLDISIAFTSELTRLNQGHLLLQCVLHKLESNSPYQFLRKVLMRAMYGTTVATTYICSVFAAAFSGYTKNLLDLPVPARLPWAHVFSDVQTTVNTEIRNIFSCGEFAVLRELHAADACSKKLYPFLQDGFGPAEAELFKNSVSDSRNTAEKLSQGLDNLSKVVDGFFKIVDWP